MINRMQEIPVIQAVDIVVAGGSTAGVAAAIAAAKAGATVFLGATDTYLGDDVCATGRLWIAPTDEPADELARACFGETVGSELVIARPMQVKERLDAALVEAGVEFLFGCSPVDVLRDAAGQLAGLVFGTRSGLIAIRAKIIVDATPRALAARLAGAEARPWKTPLTCRRIVVGHRAPGDDGSVGRPLGPPLVLPIGSKHDRKEVPFEAFEYVADLPVDSPTPAALAAAEKQMRDRTWHREQIWASDRIACLYPDAIVGRQSYVGRWPGASQLDLDTCRPPIDGLYVASPCLDTSRDAASALFHPLAAILLGRRLGEAAAAEAGQRTVQGQLRLAHTTSEQVDESLREPLRDERFAHRHLGTIALGTRDLPVLAEVDVLVAGGGTGGAPAGIGAASDGASTLVVEYLHGLGGVGTLGQISSYYYGYLEGFTAVVNEGVTALSGQDSSRRWNPEHKSEWLRQELGRQGAGVWFGSIATGAIVENGKLRGALVATPWGYGLVRAKVVIDATGNSDVAAAAGAAYTTTGADEIAVQGSGLPFRPVPPAHFNSDYTFIEDADIVDVSRAFVVGRRKFSQSWDMGQLIDTRERRQIVGDAWLTPLDMYCGRTFADSICMSRSNFDTHGMTIHPLFLVEPPNHDSIDAYVPIGTFLPRGIGAIAVTGLGLSAHRDVMPVLRMQADVQNHSYALGLAAVAALAHDGELRAIDLAALRRRLATLGILPADALTHGDSFPLPEARIRDAIAGPLNDYTGLATILAFPAVARPHLQQAWNAEKDPERRLRLAKLLAVSGDATGAQTILDAVAAQPWDGGWNFKGMGQFGACMSPLDSCIVTLGLAQVDAAWPVVRDKLAALDASVDFSHHRAVAVYCERVRPADAAPRLAALLASDGMSGHDWSDVREELGNIPASHIDTTTRNVSLRELILARALYRCGDCEGVGKAILERYTRDLRGHYARHARAVLEQD